MLHPSTQKLIFTLVEMTDRREAPWAEDANGVVGFETEGYRVEATRDPPQVRILAANGVVVERADAALLSATPWPGGGNFAAQVARMCVEGGRRVRGADVAVEAIQASLDRKAQPKPAPAPEPAPPPVIVAVAVAESGEESAAAMASAVGDMATRLRDMPLKPAPAIAPPAAREMFDAIVVAPATPPPVERLPPVPLTNIPEPRNIHTHAMFGRTPSFSVGPRPAPMTQAVVVGGLSASTVQAPEGKLTPPHVEPVVSPAAKGYRPWS